MYASTAVNRGFYDARLETTHRELRAALDCCCTGQLNRLASTRAQHVKFSRFLHNPRVHLDQLISGMVRDAVQHIQRTGREHVLVLGDTTEANLKATQGYRRDAGLGVTGNNSDAGFFLHPGLAVCPDTGQTLGCVSLQVWTRGGSADVDYTESQKWFHTARHVAHLAPRVTLVNDREGDIYDLWVHLQLRGLFLVTRARQNRTLRPMVGRSGRLWQRLAETEVSGHFLLKLKSNPKKGRTARESLFALRFTSVELKTPKDVPRHAQAGHVALTAIELVECEECVPEGEQPVVWRLLTNHVVKSFEQALQIVQWYVYRWRIEDTFSAFKTKGLDMEATRLSGGMAVMKLGVMAYESAAKVTEMVKAREDQVMPATRFFESRELECMDDLLTELEGKTQKQKNPYPSRTAAWAIWIIARLGHWHGAGKPGLMIIRRGLERFEAVFLGWNAKIKS